MRDAQLSVDSVEFAYRKGSGAGFGPFSFEAQSGQIWAVLGSNGAGKSTLLKLVSGELKPRRGTIWHDGTVEFIPQGLTIPGHLTVTQVFDYLALLRGTPAQERPDAIAQAIESVRLTEQKDNKITHLSGGQQRRAVIGQALIANPAILLMDEPSVGLDIDQRTHLRQTLQELGRDRLVFISSHIVEDLAGVADHVLHIKNGTISFAGTSSDYLAITADDTNLADGKSVDTWVNAYHAWNRSAS